MKLTEKENNYIEIINAKENNLKGINLKIKKHEVTVFVGPSGSGKSSLVFDTIAATSRRELNETFPSFTQQYLPKFGEADVQEIKNLPVAIVIDQKRLHGNARSTLETYVGIYSLVRLLFSRIGKPFVGYSDSFSFNLPQGMCPKCQGLGYIDDINENKLINMDKSINQGAINFVSFGPGSWRWKRYAYSGLFDNDKLLKDFSKKEYDLLVFAPKQKLKNPPKEWPKSASYEGLIPRIRRSIINSKEGTHHKKAIEELITRKTCPLCNGARLKQESLRSRINGLNIGDINKMDLKQFDDFLTQINDPLAVNIVRELKKKIGSLIDIGLDYLSLDRNTSTLSGGEAQRIKIAKFLTSSLSDIVYVLDEPTVGLHPFDIQLVKRAISKLKEGGNTILIVEHNPEIIKGADQIVEIGPKSGSSGGQLLFSGTYKELLQAKTITSQWLRKSHDFKKPRTTSTFINIKNANENNLKNIALKLPLKTMTVISGVAGSGKSSLVADIKKELNQGFVDLSQAPVGVNIRSTPATYLDILDPIRKMFGKKYKKPISYFSYNGKGACPRCKGKGVTITNMAFMDPIISICESCHGKRYSQEALSFKLKGKTVADILNFSVKEAKVFFKNQIEIEKKLTNLKKVGLGYLKLNQSLTTLSGGEQQRIKLAIELNKKGQIYLLDEPTAGLHMQDTDRLIRLFQQMTDQGNSLIIIEHNLELITKADWLIDMGPGAGKYGGKLMFSGFPADSIKCKESKTGQALSKYIKNIIN